MPLLQIWASLAATAESDVLVYPDPFFEDNVFMENASKAIVNQHRASRYVRGWFDVASINRPYKTTDQARDHWNISSMKAVSLRCMP